MGMGAPRPMCKFCFILSGLDMEMWEWNPETGMSDGLSLVVFIGMGRWATGAQRHFGRAPSHESRLFVGRPGNPLQPVLPPA